MVPWWATALLIVGINFTLWGLIGILRLVDESVVHWRKVRLAHGSPTDQDANVATSTHSARVEPRDVAVLMAAHNEEVVIEDSLRSIMNLLPADHIHLVSDASTDATLEIAERMGVRAISTSTNVGKAGALQEGIRRFSLIDRFQAVLLLDADTRVEPGYFTSALPLFDDPEVVAVAGCVKTAWRGRGQSLPGRVLIGHRERIYAIAQRLQKFGQTWSHANATHIVPGFASMYRTSVLPYIDLNPPGLVIEDFNMTFEVYRKRLGKVGFTLGAIAITQDPDNFHDYVRQTKRWSLGLWQTIRRHRLRANLFTLMLSVLLIELLSSSLLFVLLPPLLLVLALPAVEPNLLTLPVIGPAHSIVAAHISPQSLLIGVVVPDYAMTCLVVLLDRRPALLLYGVFFPFLRMVDAAIALYVIPLAWMTRSNGRWSSPARRTMPSVSRTDEPVREQLRSPVGAAAASASTGRTALAEFTPIDSYLSAGSAGYEPLDDAGRASD